MTKLSQSVVNVCLVFTHALLAVPIYPHVSLV